MIDRWSLIHIFLVILVMAGQIWFLKSFFEENKSKV
jgi:hypothetical protein